jgi:hypothetical protein
MSHAKELSQKVLRLQEKRDNILYALLHQELPDAATLRLQAQLSAVEDELVLLYTRKAA